MRYVVARLDEYQREQTYRNYVTKSLQLIPQNAYITASLDDILHPERIDTRSGDEIAADVIRKAGLSFG